MYGDNTTDICWPSGHIENVSMERGVKHGDPLSPWIFNSVMDELLETLPLHVGAEIGGGHIQIIP